MLSYDDKKRALRDRLKATSGEVRLQQNVTHLFGTRERPPSARLDVRALNEGIAVEADAATFECEGMNSCETLAAATFARGVLCHD